jgi:hypothetical protein
MTDSKIEIGELAFGTCMLLGLNACLSFEVGGFNMEPF